MKQNQHRKVEEGSQALYEGAHAAFRALWETFESHDAKASGLVGYTSVIIGLSSVASIATSSGQATEPVCLLQVGVALFLVAIGFALAVLWPRPVDVPADPAELVDFWESEGDDKTYGLLVENMLKMDRELMVKIKKKAKLLHLAYLLLCAGLACVVAWMLLGW